VNNAWAGLIGALVGGLIVAGGNYLVTKREAEVKMIEIAVGILAAKPDESIKPARAWAVDVLDRYSRDVRLSDEVKRALLDHPLPVRPVGVGPLGGTGALGTFPFGGGPIGPSPD